MSIALAYGLIDIKQIITDLLERYEENENNYESFIREVMFREFYYVLMAQYPHSAHEAFNENIVLYNGLITKKSLIAGVKVKLVFLLLMLL